LESFDGSCFGHALSKLCNYATTYGKMFINLNYAFIKVAQSAVKNVLHDPKNPTMACKLGRSLLVYFRKHLRQKVIFLICYEIMAYS
jgi:hypothetical protein